MAWSGYVCVRSAGFAFEPAARLGVLTQSAGLRRYEALWAERLALETELTVLTQVRAPAALANLERKLRRGGPLQVSELAETLRGPGAALLERRARVLAQLADCRHSLEVDFHTQLDQARRQLLDLLATPAVREALLLSNSEALKRIDALVGRGTERIDRRARQRLRLGWKYVQRLCARSDSVSFFGPLAWGRFSDADGAALSVEQGLPWLARRNTSFKHWVVSGLAAAMAADPALREQLPLALAAGCHVESNVLYDAAGQSEPLDKLGVALFAALAGAPRGRLSRAALLACLMAHGFDGARVQALLARWQARAVLVAGFDLASGAGEPMPHLRQQLRALALPAQLAAPWLDLLAKLDALRAEFAGGALDVRIRVLEDLATLLRGAGVDPAPVQCGTSAGRLPVYEDCARDLHVVLGGGLACQLKAELEPVWPLYSWLVGAVAVRLHDRYLACWRQARGDEGGQLDFLCFAARLERPDIGAVVQAEVREMVRRGWTHILAGRHEVHEVALDGARLGRLLAWLEMEEPRAAAFPAPGKSIHSLDFMLAARDVAAVGRGEYRIVIDAWHPGVHTLSQSAAQPFCPYAQPIQDELQAALAPRTVVAADPSEHDRRSGIGWLEVPALVAVPSPHGAAPEASALALSAARAVVLLRDGVLTYRDLERGIEQDLLTVMPGAARRVCFALAGEVGGQVEPRRLVLGRIVLKRQTWQVEGAELPGQGGPGEHLDSYLAWRRWGARRGLPRHVFVEYDSGRKPLYVDFCNPLALDLLASVAKTRPTLRFSEMRPAPDELWLSDTGGHYCSAFRTSHVGPARAPPATSIKKRTPHG
ncbi:MAG: lantibiotic dehydratase [Pseudomonadota bacterium]